MFGKLHSRLGDFWWYSLMLFCACRAGDVLNAFVGLWLVPKYVGTKELGAVMPLTSFASFLVLPVSIFATTFMKEMTTLATRGEYGKMKSLMRGVFIGAAIFLVVALVSTKFALPYFLERIRVAKGSLGFLIIASSFIGAVCPVYQNALQALKRFKTLSLLSVLGAPIRFLAMLVAMPFRALAGYFVGQASTPAFTIAASVWSLRKELSVPAEPYWTKSVVRQFAFMMIGTAAYYYAGSILGLTEQTILRQRLPDIDSAAYYMTTRFSEIAGFIHATLTMVLFPFTASLAAEGKSTRPLVVKSSCAMLATSMILALVFALVGKPMLTLLPDGNQYAEFAWTIPCLIVISAISGIQSFHTATEISAGRFGFLKWWIPVNIILAVILLLSTGYGYFAKYIPAPLSNFLETHNFTSLKSLIVWFFATAVLKALISLFELMRQRPTSLRPEP